MKRTLQALLPALSFAAMAIISGCGDLAGDLIGSHGGNGGVHVRPHVNALNFDGKNDYVLVPNDRQLQIHSGGSFTIDGWVRSEGWGTWNWVASHATSNDNNDFLFGFDNGYMRFITCDLSNDLFGKTHLQTGKWYHVAGVQDVENGTMRVYLNGELEGTTRLSGRPETTTGNLFIGAREWYGSGRAVELFNGLIHELRIWRQAMTQEQIRDLMHVRVNNDRNNDVIAGGYESKLIAHWPLNEGSGVTAYDHSGNSHHGTIYGDAVWSMVEDPIK